MNTFNHFNGLLYASQHWPNYYTCTSVFNKQKTYDNLRNSRLPKTKLCWVCVCSHLLVHIRLVCLVFVVLHLFRFHQKLDFLMNFGASQCMTVYQMRALLLFMVVFKGHLSRKNEGKLGKFGPTRPEKDMPTACPYTRDCSGKRN